MLTGWGTNVCTQSVILSQATDAFYLLKFVLFPLGLLNHTGIKIFTVNLEPKHLYLPLNINIIFLAMGELLIGFMQTEILKISFISEIEGI